MWQCTAGLRTQIADISPPDSFDRPSRLGKEKRFKLFSHHKCLRRRRPHNAVSRATGCPRAAGWTGLPHSVCDVSVTVRVCPEYNLGTVLLYGTKQSKIKIYSSQWRTQDFFSGGRGVQQIQLKTEDRENGDLGAVAPPLVRGSGGSCNLVQEISFHIVKFS